MSHVPKAPVVFSLVHALAWTEVEMREYPQQKKKGEGVYRRLLHLSVFNGECLDAPPGRGASRYQFVEAGFA